MAPNTPESDAPSSVRAVQRGHEVFDLDVGTVRWFSVGIVALLIATAAVAFTMLGGFRISLPSMSADPTPAAFPTLQNAPQDELHRYRQGKADALAGYRWIDRGSGVVQIPIERAMELVAAQPFALQVAPPVAPTVPGTAAAVRQDRRPTR
jgi:hypothetical protein